MHSFVQVAPRACRPDPREMVLNQYRGISLHATRPGGGQRGGARWTRETGQRRRPREHPAEGDQEELVGNPKALWSATGPPQAADAQHSEGARRGRKAGDADREGLLWGRTREHRAVGVTRVQYWSGPSGRARGQRRCRCRRGHTQSPLPPQHTRAPLASSKGEGGHSCQL